MKIDTGFGVSIEFREEGLFLESPKQQRILTKKGSDIKLIKRSGISNEL